MQARMNNPVMLIPEALQAFGKAAERAGVAAKTLGLIEVRASQINGCSVCVDMHAKHLKKAGETGERLFAVSAWAGCSLLYGCRTRRARSHGGRHAPQRSPGSGVRRDLERSRPGTTVSNSSLACLSGLRSSTSGTGSTSPPGKWRAHWMKSAEARKWVEAGMTSH